MRPDHQTEQLSPYNRARAIVSNGHRIARTRLSVLIGRTCRRFLANPAGDHSLRIATRRLFLAAAVIVLVVSGSAQVRGGSYFLIDDPQDQNGWTLSGYITTDTGGTLGVSDITSWSWTITKQNTQPITISSDQNAAGVYLSQVTATETSIDVQPGGQLALYAIPSGSLYTYTLLWAPQLGSYSCFTIVYPPLWEAQPPTGFGTGAWTVASIPEPSSIVLTATGVGCAMAYGLARKRRAHQK